MCCDTMEPCRKGAGQVLAQDHGLVLEISGYKSILSKVEAVECSKIGHSWAVSTNPTGIVSTDSLWLR